MEIKTHRSVNIKSRENSLVNEYYPLEPVFIRQERTDYNEDMTS